MFVCVHLLRAATWVSVLLEIFDSVDEIDINDSDLIGPC